MSLTVEEMQLVLELARRVAGEDGVAPDPEWLAAFETDCELVLAERRASADGAG